mmetsp:Transcript_66038/g.157913  ORF Transcript_66038/g.157913 Transcript_66038/m.157913 type:complete len:473 (-) Transcript_66038:135-1553(-)
MCMLRFQVAAAAVLSVVCFQFPQALAVRPEYDEDGAEGASSGPATVQQVVGDWCLFFAQGQTTKKKGVSTDKGYEDIRDRIDMLAKATSDSNPDDAWLFAELMKVTHVLVAPTPGAMASAMSVIALAWIKQEHVSTRPRLPEFKLAWGLQSTKDWDVTDLAGHLEKSASNIASLTFGTNPLAPIAKQLAADYYSVGFDNKDPPPINAEEVHLNLRQFKVQLSNLASSSRTNKVLIVADNLIGSYLCVAGLPRIASATVENRAQNVMHVMRQRVQPLAEAGIAALRWSVVDPQGGTSVFPYFAEVKVLPRAGFDGKLLNTFGQMNVPFDSQEWSGLEVKEIVPAGAKWLTMAMVKQKHKTGAYKGRSKVRKVNLVYYPATQHHSQDTTTGKPQAFMSWSEPFGEQIKGYMSLFDVAKISFHTDNSLIVQLGTTVSEWYTLNLANANAEDTLQQHELFVKTFKEYKTLIGDTVT